jgi:hypothetical protein
MLLNRESVCLVLGRLFPGWADGQLRNPVLLIGVARSGTTVLADLLGTHPQVANWSELNHLWDPRGYPWEASDHSRPPDWADPHAFVRAWWSDTPPEYRRAIRRALGVYQAFARRPVLLNKSPMHTFRVTQMLEMIPEARFVYLVRDGRAVVNSYAGKIAPKIQTLPEAYRNKGLDLSFDELVLALARHWAEAQRQYNQYKGCLRADQLLAVRYEDLCAQPRQVLGSMMQFMGVAPEKFDWSRTKVLADRNDQWRNALPEALRREAQAIMADGLSQWGYALA